jgi:uncharacterized Ntn-hydrolase superfamily protein
MTLSIAARCPRTGQVGAGALTAMLGVGKLVTHARPGVGAVTTQAYMNPYLGYDGLRRMSGGESAPEALGQLLAEDPGREQRQVGAVDIHGRPYAWTGGEVPDYGGHLLGEGYAVQGNRLVGREALEAVAEAFERHADQDFAERLVLALEAGEGTGADKEGANSAALFVVGEEEWPIWDLRIDHGENSVHDLREVYERFREKLMPVIEKLPTREDPLGGFKSDPGI